VYRDDYVNLQKLLNKDYQIIFKDRNGLYRIFGLYTGLEMLTFNSSTGGAKAEMNGFKLSFEGKEERGSYFISDLESVGFFDVNTNYRITEAGELRETQDNEFRIIQ